MTTFQNSANSTRRIRARHVGLGLTLALAAMIGAQTPARAEYPDRPVRIIVPYGAGGIATVTMRMVAERMSEKFKQQFVIENRPGAGGAIGAAAVKAAKPDGYTLSMIGNGLTIARALFKSLPYDLFTDFTPISTTAAYGLVIAVKGGSKFKTVKDVINFAKANPGKLNFGTINPGSTQNLSAELFRSMAGINVVMIPYKTSPDLMTAVLQGDIDVAFEYYAALAPLILDKKITAIAATSDERAPQMPDVPTAAESGLPGYDVTSWNALGGPAGLPPEIVNVLNKAVREALATPEIKERMLKFGMTPRASSPEALEKLMKANFAQWEKVIADAKIKKR
jgi:tripartite-type tricarboxylate transporter receptor subunit TctC